MERRKSDVKIKRVTPKCPQDSWFHPLLCTAGQLPYSLPPEKNHRSNMRIVASAGVNAPAVRRMDNTNRKSRGKMAQTTIKQNSFPYMKNGIV